MESNILSPLPNQKKNKYFSITDDSGYMTPSSAESTAYSESISKDVSFDVSNISSFNDSGLNSSAAVSFSKEHYKNEMKLISDGINKQITFKRQDAIEEEMESNSSVNMDIDHEITSPIKEPIVLKAGNILQITPSKKNKLSNVDSKSNRKQIGKPEKNKLNHNSIKIVKSVEKRKPLKKSIHKDEKNKVVKILNFEEKFDILNTLNLSSIDCIFHHLTDEDLQNLYNVSFKYRIMIESNKVANERRLKWLHRQEINKENNVPNIIEKKEKTDLIIKRSVFSQNNSQSLSVEKVEERSPPTSPKTKNILRYYETAESNSSKELRKCPRCFKPAVLEDRICICNGKGCGYVFCKNCSNEYIDELHQCPAIESVSPSKDREERTSSKLKKRNLERLRRRLIRM